MEPYTLFTQPYTEPYTLFTQLNRKKKFSILSNQFNSVSSSSSRTRSNSTRSCSSVTTSIRPQFVVPGRLAFPSNFLAVQARHIYMYMRILPIPVLFPVTSYHLKSQQHNSSMETHHNAPKISIYFTIGVILQLFFGILHDYHQWSSITEGQCYITYQHQTNQVLT